MIVGCIEIKPPWSRTTRVSRAFRIRERREWSTENNAGPAEGAPVSAVMPGAALDVSGGKSPELDYEVLSIQAKAHAYFYVFRWSVENGLFRLDQGGILGVTCEELP